MFEADFVDYSLTIPSLDYYGVRTNDSFWTPLGSNPVYKYSLKSSEYPTLIIIDPLTDEDGNTIKPGYYELALSDMQDMFILLQSKKPLAILPVFKIEEDVSEQNPKDKKKLEKIKKKEEKQRKKTNAKRREAGMSEDEEKIDMKAEITYQPDGDYYLIMYEKGKLRAWGAVKSK